MRLEWDKTGSRLYETGVDRGVVYPAVNGAYPKGEAWNGLTGVTESPSGAEANPIYADNIKYVELRSAEEFGATVEALMYPDSFAECDGSALVADGVSIGQQIRKPFGFSYRSIVGNDEAFNDYGYKLHLIWNATVSPSEKAYQTVNDSPETATFSWEMTTTPLAVTGHKPTAHMVIDSTKADPTALEALEDILYGTDNEEAMLPLPNDVIAMFAGSSYEITLNRANITIVEGKTYALRASTTPKGETVTWTSSDDTKATVNNGTVTAVAAGSATITASFVKNGVTYSDICKVTINPAS